MGMRYQILYSKYYIPMTQEKYQLGKISNFQLLKDRVYEEIKKSVIDLSLLPNEQLVEQRLAKDLGVSKSPIREALLRLEREGLVYMRPYKGAFVAEITEKTIHEIFQLREALEVYCIKIACDTFSAEEIERAQKIVSEGREAIQQGDLMRCYDSNIHIHDYLVKKINNSRITQTYFGLIDHLNRYRIIASRIDGRVPKSQKEHILIVEALKRRNKALAGESMSKHLHSLLNDFLHSKELKGILNTKS